MKVLFHAHTLKKHIIEGCKLGDQLLFPPQCISFCENTSVSIMEGDFMRHAIHTASIEEKQQATPAYSPM